MEKKLLIFSLGGTLILSNDDVIGVWRKAIRKAGLLPDEIMIYSDHYGEDFKTIILPKMANKYNWTEKQIDSVVIEVKKVFGEINSRVNTNLADKLKSLKSFNYSLGMLSNRKLTEVECGLKKIGCSLRIFDFVKTAENGANKPDPKAFDVMFENFEAEEMIFIGSDPHKDWPAAKALGIHFIAITHPLTIGLWRAIGVKEEDIFPNVPSYLDSLLIQKSYI